MRNYISLIHRHWNVNYDDGMGNSGNFPADVAGKNEKSRASITQNYDAQCAAIIATMPGFTVTFDSIVDVVGYWLLDQNSYMQMVNRINPTLWYNELLLTAANAPISALNILNVTATPRYTGWKDAAGAIHKAAPTDKKRPDFRGAGGLVQFILNLPAYAQILKREGRARDAGIVLYAYNRVLDHTMTITDALAYLRANGL